MINKQSNCSNSPILQRLQARFYHSGKCYQCLLFVETTSKAWKSNRKAQLTIIHHREDFNQSSRANGSRRKAGQVL